MLLVQKQRSHSSSSRLTPPISPPRPKSTSDLRPLEVYDTPYALERSRSDGMHFQPITPSSSVGSFSSIESAPAHYDLFAQILVSKSEAEADTSSTPTIGTQPATPLPPPSPPRPVPRALVDDSLSPLRTSNGNSATLACVTDTLPLDTFSVGVLVEEHVDLEILQWMQPLRTPPKGGMWRQVRVCIVYNFFFAFPSSFHIYNNNTNMLSLLPTVSGILGTPRL